MSSATGAILAPIPVGGRAAGAQVYPDDLCCAILRGVVRQKAADAKESRITVPPMSPGQISSFISSLGKFEVGSVRKVSDKRMPIGCWPSHWMDDMHEADGGSDTVGPRPQRGIEILQHELDMISWKNGIAYARDDVTGVELNPDLVRDARREEMDYFRRLGVYKVVPREHQRRTGGKIVSTRWIDINKGDSSNPNYRSRLVGREFNVERDDSLYAATPPLEALRIVVSNAATWAKGKGK